MDDGIASRTAQATSLMRALHGRADARPILDDSWGDRLVPEAFKASLRRRAGGDDAAELRLRSSPAYANVIVRSRYAEDCLAAAVARGVRQYVVIGAGFDSYFLRRPAAPCRLAVFEIDHPATQMLKRERLAACGIVVPDDVHFIAADLAKEPLSNALERSTFTSSKPAFFSWLGVTMYLPREANLATFRSIARIAARDSEIVFNYADQAMFERHATDAPETTTLTEMRQAVAAAGEPFVSGFHPAELESLLVGCGLELVEDFTSAQLVERYDPEGLNKLRPAAPSHIARARVP